MARKAMIVKNNKRIKLAEKYEAYRRELRQKSINLNLSYEERQDASVKLQKLRRDSSRCRQKNRCGLTGRSRGYLRKFGLSRIAVRDLASVGKLPGVTKASW